MDRNEKIKRLKSSGMLEKLLQKDLKLKTKYNLKTMNSQKLLEYGKEKENGHLQLIQTSHSDQEKLMKTVFESVVGNLEPFYSVYGIRRTIYCDYTASGKALSFIEDYIRDQGE